MHMSLTALFFALFIETPIINGNRKNRRFENVPYIIEILNGEFAYKTASTEPVASEKKPTETAETVIAAVKNIIRYR